MTDPARRTRNRDPRRFHVNATVDQLLRAIADNDRWAMARRTTGPLLRAMLAADGGEPHPYASLQRAGYIAVGNHPLSVVDDDVAILIGSVTGLATQPELPVTAVLIASDDGAVHWLVASLDIDGQTNLDVRLAAVRGMFSEASDREVIAAARPLDSRAAAIDWNDPAAVIRTFNDGRAITVAEARSEVSEFSRPAWPWLADEAPFFGSLYLRAAHPELVREFREYE